MFLRSADGKSYINSELTDKLFVNGSSEVECHATNMQGATADMVLVAAAASNAIARATRDRIVAALQGNSEGQFFLAEYQGDILYPTKSVAALTTFNGGAGQWQVRADGHNLVVSLADQAAATAAMDAIAAAVGSLDPSRLA